MNELTEWSVVSEPKLDNGKWILIIDTPGKKIQTLSFDTEQEAKNEKIKYISNKERQELSEKQKKDILDRYKDESKIVPSISELTSIAFPHIENPDGRSFEARLIKEYLSGLGIEQPKTTLPRREQIILKKEEEQYIINNCSTLRPLEMARIIFKSEKINPASLELRAVVNYIKTLDQKIVYGGEIPEVDYKPPKTLDRVLARIKKYVSVTKDWDFKKLTPTQKKNCEMLIHYLHDLRFKRQIDSYEKTEDKITFESEMIKFVYDKPDLSQEDLSQYISLCSFIVMEYSIKSNIEMLQTSLENIQEDDDKRLSMSLVEALTSARKELDECVKRQQAFYKSLTEQRSEKLKKEMSDKESLLSFFTAWKNYESRQQILKIRQQEKQNLRKELHEIENMDELKTRVLGLSIDQIIDG